MQWVKRKFKGRRNCARSYYVSTVGLNEAKIRKHIQKQEINETVEDKYGSDPDDWFQDCPDYLPRK